MRPFHSLPIHAVALWTAAMLFPMTSAAGEPPSEKTPIVFDTDIGADVDDAFALALALASPEVDLVAVTTCGDDAETRAWIVCRMLTAVGHKDIPVAWGRDPQPVEAVEGQIQYRRHPAVLYNRRVSAGEAVLPKEPANRSALVERGGFPNRVHCFEDYETDIEKRWWMSGKAETADVPPANARACRGVLTQDFDDLQGDMKTMYTAVIFNPVPGPPMGKNPRVSFR
jgi:hypothetical protein